MNRKSFLTHLAAPFLALPFALRAAGVRMQVYKTPTCGCCGKWVQHLRDNGFEVAVQDVPDTSPYRKKYGVPDKLASCHTGIVQATRWRVMFRPARFNACCGRSRRPWASPCRACRSAPLGWKLRATRPIRCSWLAPAERRRFSRSIQRSKDAPGAPIPAIGSSRRFAARANEAFSRHGTCKKEQ